MFKKIFIALSIILYLCSFVYAFDWKGVHGKADEITSKDALAILGQNPDSLENLYLLGLTYLNEYKTKEAEVIFKKMLEIDPQSKEALWGRAEVLRRKRNFKESEKILTELIKKYPDYSPSYISLAYIKYLEKEFDDTVKLAYTVVKQGKDNVDLTNFVRAHGLVAGAKGMIAHYGGPVSKVVNGRSVLPYLKKAESLQPDSPAVLFGLGSYYLLIPKIFGRDIDKAEKYLQKAVEVDPDFPDVYVRLAQIEKLRGNIRKYGEHMNKALELDPDNELARDIQQGKCEFVCVLINE